MKSLYSIILFIGLFNFLSGCKEQSGSIDKSDYSDDKFKVGQIWKYKARTGEENSTLTILKVEKYDTIGIVIHIYVDQLKVKNPNLPNSFLEELGHLPFSKEAIVKSITELISENNKLPDFMDGYNQWKQAKGGVFSIEVSDAVKYVEETMKNGVRHNE